MPLSCEISDSTIDVGSDSFVSANPVRRGGRWPMWRNARLNANRLPSDDHDSVPPSSGSTLSTGSSARSLPFASTSARCCFVPGFGNSGDHSGAYASRCPSRVQAIACAVSPFGSAAVPGTGFPVAGSTTTPDERQSPPAVVHPTGTPDAPATFASFFVASVRTQTVDLGIASPW
jgi:hypothetical protein